MADKQQNAKDIEHRRKRHAFLSDKLRRYESFLHTARNDSYTLYDIDDKEWYTREHIALWVADHEQECLKLGHQLRLEYARALVLRRIQERIDAARDLLQRLQRFRALQKTDKMRRKYDRDIRRQQRRIRYFKRQLRGVK